MRMVSPVFSAIFSWGLSLVPLRKVPLPDSRSVTKKLFLIRTTSAWRRETARESSETWQEEARPMSMESPAASLVSFFFVSLFVILKIIDQSLRAPKGRGNLIYATARLLRFACNDILVTPPPLV